MAYVKVTSMMDAELKEARAQIHAQIEQDMATLLQVTEEEIDPIASRLELLSALLADLQVRVAQLEAQP